MAFENDRPIVQGTLYDSSGNAVAVNTIDGVKRLAVDVVQAENVNVNVTVGQTIPADLNRYISALAVNGSSSNLIVDGSSTPVLFDHVADPTKDIAVSEVRLIASCQDITFDGVHFGGLATLTNGLLVQLINANGTQTIFNIKINENFLMFPSPVGILLNNTGPKDVFSAGFFLGNSILRAGTTDKVRITVRDNLTGGGSAQFDFLQARVYGVKAA